MHEQGCTAHAQTHRYTHADTQISSLTGPGAWLLLLSSLAPIKSLRGPLCQGAALKGRVGGSKELGSGSLLHIFWVKEDGKNALSAQLPCS